MWPAFTKHYLQRSGGNEYWYLQNNIRINGKVRTIRSYVGPKDLSEDEMKKAIEVAIQKYINSTNELYYDEKKRKYTYKILSKLDVEKLETLRFDYSFRFKNLYPSAFEQYKKANYIKYVHGTTAIEGNTFTLAETRQILQDELSVAGKSLREQYEIQNYKQLRNFVEDTSQRFDSRFIRKLHSIICANIPSCNPGELRNIPVFIRGMNIETSPAAAVETDLEELVDIYKRHRRDKHHIVELAGIFHQRFEEIHPFADGNGRVGREIINVMLERADYPPVFFEKEDRPAYINALGEGNKVTNEKYPIVDLIKQKLLENHQEILEKVKSYRISESEAMGKKISQKSLFDFTK